jgi:hypothetical protein
LQVKFLIVISHRNEARVTKAAITKMQPRNPRRWCELNDAGQETGKSADCPPRRQIGEHVGRCGNLHQDGLGGRGNLYSVFLEAQLHAIELALNRPAASQPASPSQIPVAKLATSRTACFRQDDVEKIAKAVPETPAIGACLSIAPLCATGSRSTIDGSVICLAGRRASDTLPRDHLIHAGATRLLQKKQRREGKGPCLTDAAHLTLARRAVRGFRRYAIVRTSSIAISAAGFAEVES